MITHHFVITWFIFHSDWGVLVGGNSTANPVASDAHLKILNPVKTHVGPFAGGHGGGPHTW